MTTTSAMTEPGDRQGVWIYAVAEQIPGTCLSQVTGVSGEPVRAVVAGELTAAAGDVPLAEYGEAALRRNLENLEWLDRTARAHHRVIDAVSQQGPVVPMRLATVYRDDANVAAALAERGADFRTALERTRGCREWGVKVYATAPGAQSGGTGPAAGEGSGEAAGSGAAYLRRKRGELTARQDSRRASLSSADAIHAALCELSAATRLHPPQAPELAGISGQMLLNGAYLLDADDADEFAAAVQELARRHPAVKVELTGPWPPYSFTGLTPSDEA